MNTIRNKIHVACICAVAIAISPIIYFSGYSLSLSLLIICGSLLLAFICASIATKELNEGIRAIDVGLQNFKDGDFSCSVAYEANDEFGELCDLYNATSEQLRNEKQWIYQRELMLDKVLQSSPDVLLLVNDQDKVVFSNYQARAFFEQSYSLEGYSFGALLNSHPEALKHALLNNQQGLISFAKQSGEVNTWHISTGRFLLHNQPHILYILKQMTRELNRQEVTVWKKVIRVISHELNNSLGPISSLLHSGQILSEQKGDQRLERVFKTIEDRIEHLNQFVQGYGKFAKLPAPKLEAIQWTSMLVQLQQQYPFKLKMHEHVDLHADPIQLEQLLINLLKNAHESGSSIDDIELMIKKHADRVIIEVNDAGKGMTETVMTNALIPFYSTKASGSGLGLALCREIADAHHGALSIQNREPNGLCVRVVF